MSRRNIIDLGIFFIFLLLCAYAVVSSNSILIYFAATVAYAAYFWVRYKQRRHIYRWLRSSYTARDAIERVFDIRYRSVHTRFLWTRYFFWDSLGLLIMRSNGITLYIVREGRHDVKEIYLSPRCNVIDPIILKAPRGFLNWCFVGQPPAPEHMITAESGYSELSSREDTLEIVTATQAVLHLLRCQRCGYRLAGNETGICPECGVNFPRPNKSPVPNEKVVSEGLAGFEQ